MLLINKLSNAGIIDQQEAIELDEELSRKDSQSKDKLEILYSFFTKKITGASGSFFVIVDSPEEQNDGNHHPKKQHSEFLEILYQEEIIPEPVYQKIRTIPHIANEPSCLAILHLSIELMSFYRSFTIENQLAFASLLEGKSPYGTDSLLDVQKKEDLIQDIKANKLETYLDFFSYCHTCRLINIVSYRGKEHLLLEEAVKILNQLCYDTFTIAETASYDMDFNGEPSYHNKQTTIIVSTGAREHRYTYTFWQDDNGNRRGNNIGLLLENLLLLANQLLADFNATYRLTGITNYLSEALFPGSRAVYAICRFQQENSHILEFYAMQKRFLFNRPAFFIRFPLSYQRIEYALYHINKCGLLGHLDRDEYDTILKDVYESTYNHVSDLLAIFPDTIVAVNRIVSSGHKPYHDFLLALNRVSRGVLNFTDIDDGIPADFTFESELTFKVSFRCNGDHHVVDCNLIGKEFSDSLVYYIINEIVRKKYSQYRLIQLINGNPTQDTYFFVANHQSEYLQSMKLLEAIERF